MGEKWINQRGFLKGYVKPRKETSFKVDDDAQPENVKYGVPYYPIRCPQCKSKNQTCYQTKFPVRYHKCRDCGTNFKSTERESSPDSGDDPLADEKKQD